MGARGISHQCRTSLSAHVDVPSRVTKETLSKTKMMVVRCPILNYDHLARNNLGFRSVVLYRAVALNGGARLITAGGDKMLVLNSVRGPHVHR